MIKLIRKTVIFRKLNIISTLLFMCLFFINTSAHAACISPAGVAGEQIYNSTHDVMQFCNGDDWVSMTCGEGQGTSPCTAPEEGEQQYNSAQKVMQFCDGTNWIAMACFDPIPTSFSPTLIDSLNNRGQSWRVSNTVTFDVGGEITILGSGGNTSYVLNGSTVTLTYNGGAWQDTINVSSGDTLALRATNQAQGGTCNQMSILASGTTYDWDVCTKDYGIQNCTTGMISNRKCSGSVIQVVSGGNWAMFNGCMDRAQEMGNSAGCIMKGGTHGSDCAIYTGDLIAGVAGESASDCRQ